MTRLKEVEHGELECKNLSGLLFETVEQRGGRQVLRDAARQPLAAVTRTGAGDRTRNGVPLGMLTNPSTEPKCTNPVSADEAPVLK